MAGMRNEACAGETNDIDEFLAEISKNISEKQKGCTHFDRTDSGSDEFVHARNWTGVRVAITKLIQTTSTVKYAVLFLQFVRYFGC